MVDCNKFVIKHEILTLNWIDTLVLGFLEMTAKNEQLSQLQAAQARWKWKRKITIITINKTINWNEPCHFAQSIANLTWWWWWCCCERWSTQWLFGFRMIAISCSLNTQTRLTHTRYQFAAEYLLSILVHRGWLNERDNEHRSRFDSMGANTLEMFSPFLRFRLFVTRYAECERWAMCFYFCLRMNCPWFLLELFSQPIIKPAIHIGCVCVCDDWWQLTNYDESIQLWTLVGFSFSSISSSVWSAIETNCVLFRCLCECLSPLRYVFSFVRYFQQSCIGIFLFLFTFRSTPARRMSWNKKKYKQYKKILYYMPCLKSHRHYIGFCERKQMHCFDLDRNCVYSDCGICKWQTI